jgi:hypothetical protein
MARRVGRARLRYWFDNTMSKGTVSLIGWLDWQPAPHRYRRHRPVLANSRHNGVKRVSTGPPAPSSAFGLAYGPGVRRAPLAFVLGALAHFNVGTLIGLLVPA